MLRRSIFLSIALLVFTLCAALSAEIPVEFRVDTDCNTSAGVFNSYGHLVRTLWSMKSFTAGNHKEVWDGLDDFQKKAPAGKYQIRISSSKSVYHNMGVIGENGPDVSVQSSVADLLIDKTNGDIYTANAWEEAGQEFKKQDKNGKHRMNAQFRVRNGVGGVPGGAPLAITQENGIIYYANFTMNEVIPGRQLPVTGGAIICRYRADNGNLIKFPQDPGYIRIYAPDPNRKDDPWNHQTILSLAIVGNALAATDKEGNRVLKYNKITGLSLGEFTVSAPTCMIADDQQRLWIAHDKNKLTIFSFEGKVLASPKLSIGEIACIRFGPKHQFWIADRDAANIQVYDASSPEKLRLLKTIGRKAKVGEFTPLSFYTIKSFDVDSKGGFVIAQSPRCGTVLSSYSEQGKLRWQMMGLEFCTNGTYDPQEPDLFISNSFHSYRLKDKGKTGGEWQYEGNILTGDSPPEFVSAGNSRVLRFGGKRFLFVSRWDCNSIYRFDGKKLILASRAGTGSRWCSKEVLATLTEKQKLGPMRFAWSDKNGDGNMQVKEVDQIETGDNARVFCFCSEMDDNGNILFCNQTDWGVYELPRGKLDPKGNPMYDWTKLRRVISPDTTSLGLRTMKVIRTPDGAYYALQQANPSIYPPMKLDTPWGQPHETAWMGGWVLSKYNSSGERLFTISLPKHCTGIDWIPNADRTASTGLIIGYFKGTEIYHFSTDGLLLGVFSPTHDTGWLDHNGSIDANRNPKDGMVDLFAEESLHNRISWYRIDDRSVKTSTVTVQVQ